MTTPTQRRAPGAGGIDPLPSGRFRVRPRIPGKGRVSLGTYDTREEAEEVLAAALAELAGGGLAPTGALTLRQWGESWLSGREASGLHRSSRSERSLWETHVAKAIFADWSLQKLTRPAVRAWIVELQSTPAHYFKAKRNGHRNTEPLKQSSVNRIRGLLSAALQAAVEDGLIPTNPALGIRVKPKDDASEWTFLTEAEVQTVTTSPLVPDWARVIYTVAIYTGLRKGELWALRWEDVTLEGDRPEIFVRRGKTRAARRHVPLLAPARAALERWKGACPKNTRCLVFPTREGRLRGVSDDAGWSERWPEGKPLPGYRARLGIRPKVTFHDLRHTCASHLVMGTWGPAWRLEEVRDYLGHTSIAMTQRYAHLSPEHLHRRAAATTGPAWAKGWPTTAEVSPESANQSATLRDSSSSSVSKIERQESREVATLRGPLLGHATAFLAQVSDPGATTVPLSELVALARAALSRDEVGRLALAVLDEQDPAMALERAVTLAGRLLVDEALKSRKAQGAG